MIYTRQLQLVRKLVRTDEPCIPKQLLTAWVNNKWTRGIPLTTNKVSNLKSLQLLYPKGTEAEHCPMDKVGSLSYWWPDALNKKDGNG